MTKRSQFIWVVLAAVTLVMPGVDPFRGAANAQAVQPSVRGRIVTLGRLIRSGRSSNGTPRFALLDDSGMLTAHVVPSSGLKLSSYVNQRVAITAQRSRNGSDGVRHVLAESIRPMIGDEFQLPEPEVTPTATRERHPHPQLMPEVAATAIDTSPRPTGSGVRLRTASGTPLQPIPAVAAGVSNPPAKPVPSFDDSEEQLFWDQEFGLSQDGVQRASYDDYLPEMSTSAYDTSIGLEAGYDDHLIYQDGDLGHACSNCGADVAVGCANCGSLGACGSACCPCGPSGRFWFRGEYLLWWTKGMDLPPLVTTTTGNPPAEDAGVLGVDGTQVLFGDGEIFDASRSGYRFRLGAWLDYCQWKGVEFDYFWLEDENERFSQTSVGNPILARPFFNANLNAEDAELIAYPGIVSGTVNVRANTELMALAPRFRINLRCEDFMPDGACAYGGRSECGDTVYRSMGGQRVDFTLGYRYMSLEQRLGISEQLTSVNNGSTANFNLEDTFATDNSFHGVEIGIVWEYYRGPWSMEFSSRFGLGNNRREVRIAGATDSAVQGAVFTDTGGLLALPSNIGRYADDEFAVIPELGVNLGYQIAPSVRFVVGYTFIYWNDVVQPGDQIDLRVNPDLLPPAVDTAGRIVPAFAWNDSSFWAQGLNLGFDWRW